MQPADLGAPPAPLAEILAGYPPDLFTVELHRGCELADIYTLEHATELLRRLGVAAALAEPASLEQLAERLDFAAAFRPALGWLLERGVAAGTLARENGRAYRWASPAAAPRFAELREVGESIDPRHGATLDLLDAAAAVYPGVAAGTVDAEVALFAPATAALWGRYFDNANPIYAVNNRVAAIAAAERLPRDRDDLQLLEIGAGGGSGSLALAAELEQRGLAGRVASYLATEPTPFFRRRAERALRAAHPGMPWRFAALDIDADWPAQSVPAGSLDLVFGVNVMHVATDLPASLTSAWRALRPGGWLVLGECLRPMPDQPLWPEFIFRLLDGFNGVRLDPELRPNPGFLTPEQWLRALGAVGFEAPEVEPDLRRIRQYYERFLTGALCARRPLASDL